jgi:hypothetical protein
MARRGEKVFSKDQVLDVVGRLHALGKSAGTTNGTRYGAASHDFDVIT